MISRGDAYGSKRTAAIAVLSYEASKHPRAQKVYLSLRRRTYNAFLWEARKPVRRGPRMLRALLNYLFALFEVGLVRADIYWVENVPDVIYLPLAMLGRKYVYDRRSPWALHMSVEAGPVGNVATWLAHLIERYVASRSAAVTVPSTPLGRDNYGPKDVFVVPNYPEESFTCPHSADLKRELGTDSETAVFLYMARLSRIEGAHMVPRIAEAIRGLKAEIWVAGDGPLRGLIEGAARSNPYLRWLGWVKRSEVPRYIAASDYGLVPREESRARVFYTHEGIQKIAEFLRCGKPVIASGVMPTPYYITVPSAELPSFVARVARGEVHIRRPPRIPTWEEFSEPAIANIVDGLMGGGLGASGPLRTPPPRPL